MTMLSVQGLGKSFGEVRALADAAFDVEQGARTAIVGPSGSGKTTLLRLIAGFETPDSGRIVLDGQLVADDRHALPAHRRNVGLVMQEGALFPHLSVVENIGYGIRRLPEARRRALELMDLVELARSMADRRPHELSGGQQQRVAVARALARSPRLMLLDEPFSALDAGLREQLRDAMRRILAEAGVATVLVTHDQDEAMSFADQLVVLREGRLVQSGTPRDLYLAPADPQTAAFLGPAIILDAEIGDGMARCMIGDLPLPPGRKAVPGTGKIMLRHEQLALRAELPPDGAAETRRERPWFLRKIEHAGPRASVTVVRSTESGSDEVLTFRTTAGGLPQTGARVSLDVSGNAYPFP